MACFFTFRIIQDLTVRHSVSRTPWRKAYAAYLRAMTGAYLNESVFRYASSLSSATDGGSALTNAVLTDSNSSVKSI